MRPDAWVIVQNWLDMPEDDQQECPLSKCLAIAKLSAVEVIAEYAGQMAAESPERTGFYAGIAYDAMRVARSRVLLAICLNAPHAGGADWHKDEIEVPADTLRIAERDWVYLTSR